MGFPEHSGHPSWNKKVTFGKGWNENAGFHFRENEKYHVFWRNSRKFVFANFPIFRENRQTFLYFRENFMSSTYFHKNGLFVSHVTDEFCLFFIRNLKKSTFVNFRKLFRRDCRENVNKLHTFASKCLHKWFSQKEKTQISISILQTNEGNVAWK